MNVQYVENDARGVISALLKPEPESRATLSSKKYLVNSGRDFRSDKNAMGESNVAEICKGNSTWVYANGISYRETGRHSDKRRR